MGTDTGNEVIGTSVTTDLADLALLFLGYALAKQIPSADARRHMRDAIASVKGVPGEDIEGEAESIAETL